MLEFWLGHTSVQHSAWCPQGLPNPLPQTWPPVSQSVSQSPACNKWMSSSLSWVLGSTAFLSDTTWASLKYKVVRSGWDAENVSPHPHKPTDAVTGRRCKDILRWHQFTTPKLPIWNIFSSGENLEHLSGIYEPLHTFLSILWCTEVCIRIQIKEGCIWDTFLEESPLLQSFCIQRSPTKRTLQRWKRHKRFK